MKFYVSGVRFTDCFEGGSEFPNFFIVTSASSMNNTNDFSISKDGGF